MTMRAVKRNPKLEEAPLQGELMLFDPANSKFFLLNRTMAFIWRQCEGEQTETALADSLLREFEGADLEQARSDVGAALAELMNLGLLVDSGTAGA